MAPLRFRVKAFGAIFLLAFFGCDSPSAPKTGSLVLTIQGLPPGTDAAIAITGPTGTTTPAAKGETLSNLPPGTYTITASDVAADEIYSATTATQTIQLSTSTKSVTVTYHAVTGTLSLTSAGLPASATPTFDITGPQNYSASVTGSRLISRLPPGDYTVTARVVTDKTDQYRATNSPFVATVTAGASTSANAQYALLPATLDMRVDGAYLTQSVQRYDGSVPLVAGRTAYLRVFPVANEDNSAAPAARLRLFSNGVLVSTRNLDPKPAGVPFEADQSSASRSWSIQIDGSLIQQGFGFVVDLDPDNLIREVNESNNTFPANGSPRVQSVQSVASLDVRFVPILTTINGFTGVVNDTNKDSYLETALRMYPLSTYSAEVRAPFSTNAAVGPGPDEVTTLNQVLNELDALRVAEGSTKYYAGIIKIGSGSSFSGVAVIGQPTTLSYDLQPGAPVALAHEFGHTAGRRHAPCGGAANPDPNYPYFGASIGTYGFDVAAQTIYSPASTFDLMSYCAPRWLSDYTYVGVMDFRSAAQLSAQRQSTSKESLVVWGRLENGRLILEPAFSAGTSAPLPNGGSYEAEAFDTNNSRLFAVGFEPARVADASPDSKQFAIAIPLEARLISQIAVIRVTGAGKTAERRTIGTESLNADNSSVTISDAAPGKRTLAVSWRRDIYEMAVIRDADTGEILAFGRNGRTTVSVPSGKVDVTLTDGVQSVRGSVRPEKQ
ncbi:MAG: hypothetical protein ABR582_06830 [Gemmatimonadaceae bacterium]